MHRIIEISSTLGVWTVGIHVNVDSAMSCGLCLKSVCPARAYAPGQGTCAGDRATLDHICPNHLHALNDLLRDALLWVCGDDCTLQMLDDSVKLEICDALVGMMCAQSLVISFIELSGA